MTNLTAENDAISKLAYEYWEGEGRPHGRDVEHWLRAERSVAESVKEQARAAKKLKHAPVRGRVPKRSTPQN